VPRRSPRAHVPRRAAQRQDKVKGKLQINYGLTCSPEGRPVAIGVHDGNITDQQTLPDAVHAVADRFGMP